MTDLNDGTISAAAVALRLTAAVIAGVVLGLNRELRMKPAGLKTQPLVALGAAIVTVISIRLAGASDPGAVTRTIQGVVTGVGFVGGGVILHRGGEGSVRGVTTAATIWVAAALGLACGAGFWVEAAIGLVLCLLVLTGGRALEQRMVRPSAGDGDEARSRPESPASPP